MFLVMFINSSKCQPNFVLNHPRQYTNKSPVRQRIDISTRASASFLNIRNCMKQFPRIITKMNFVCQFVDGFLPEPLTFFCIIRVSRCSVNFNVVLKLNFSFSGDCVLHKKELEVLYSLAWSQFEIS